jgi:tetratricopeptide (TPR) repeat protein
VNERLKAAELAKTKGNDLYKEKKYEEAMRHYNQGLDYFNQLWSLEEEEKKKVDAVKLSLLLNLAACQQELGEYSEVYYSCCKALDIDTYNVKALYRRGKALSAQNEFEKAKADLYEAAKLAPNAKEIRVELDLLKKKIEANKQKQKDLFAAMMK